MIKLILKKVLLFITLLLIITCNSQTDFKVGITRPNVLFIAIDDLRPEIGAYGSEVAITPNIDALASEGLLFNNAYCQEAICSPSRASLMTGARPETINVIENFTYFRDSNPEIVTLPQHFRAHGYETVHTGKIYHNKEFGDGKFSWSRTPVELDKPLVEFGYKLPENESSRKKNREAMLSKYGKNALRNGLGQGPAFEFANAADNTYEDGHNTDKAIATLKDMLKNNPEKPFFLGLGMKKPHLDWVAPKKYWDLYNNKQIPLTEEDKAPKNGAAMGLHPSFELRARANIPKYGPIDTELAIELRRAYLACVSYVDAQIGRMLRALEEEGVRENTIIILWSDHGWHLGEMGIWGKATNYEIATRIPLIISTPDMPQSVRGAKSNALVELVDLYPTLCELAGLDLPEHLEGQSFSPLLQEPNKEWKEAVFSQFPNPALREWAANPLSKGMRETYFGPLIKDVEDKIKAQQGDKWNRDLFENRLMGYAMRTHKYRFVVWKDFQNKNAEPLFYELYDHQTDPHETTNIAEDNPKLVEELLCQFNKGWKGNLAVN
ncbi:sulfatase [Cytophaga sp. FL35]|uniref:sulfatase n=1 Tax=Cytophaga sp. FL35 TaxID=1904456 RepID=UPI001653948A|nr:sulfatase [Cytophaga sp. FL35]MBC6998029.1 sulfatase [Cytophaga sp. FL35]